jgi:hypothetical protein
MATLTAPVVKIAPHLFLRADYYAEDCRVCQLPRRNTRVHPDPAELPVVIDRTEPAHHQDQLLAA